MKFERAKTLVLETGYKNPDNPDPANKKVAIIMGRFQPYHKGHDLLVKEASKKYPVVLGIVSSKKAQAEGRSPFDFELLKKIAMAANPKIIDVVEFNFAALDIMIDKLRSQGYELKEWYAGSDQYPKYLEQKTKYEYDKKMNADVEIKQLHREEPKDKIAGGVKLGDISTYTASAIRHAVMNDKPEIVKEMMVKLTKGMYEKMKQQLGVK